MDIIPFDIDFVFDLDNINIVNSVNYPSLGYFLGYRFTNNNYILSSNYINNSTNITSQTLINVNDNLYLLLNINNWGNINFINKKYISKLIFTCLSTRIDQYINPVYNFKKPIDISYLDIRLEDYTGNIFDLGSSNFSFTVRLKQVLDFNKKKELDKQNLFFN